MSGTFSPGQAAQQSGFSVDTLRYYEKIGLIAIDRRANGHREFGDEDLEWLGVLRCLRDTGMPIADMRRYAELARTGDDTLKDRLRLLSEHDRHVAETIRTLQAQRKHLRDKIAWYQEQTGTGPGDGSGYL
jgi:DNA-binding transcriptional MerR regulator